ncbi:juvenile hormone esterase-like [Osmia bicornis bicornis]|uniref:juvenile hormone esterase-like n=1 Tax=Osmia bicornis bicornis TaxID=1437191 RepID=UPI001EAEA018|nr:juvenile hormone esterase-like [Osmia bicornis bicornis]
MSGATLLALVSFSFCLLANSRRTPVVNTSIGPVRGLILQTYWNGIEYSSFRGIPYAQPPVRQLRFKPPVPIKPWRKVLNAYQEGNVCPQKEFQTDLLIGDENCLFLNVFTPETRFNRRLHLRPVMVWIHGGAYSSGSSNTSLYGPDFFLEEHLVVVSFNYRLGPLGFLTLKHPDATGNAGLKDQNLVLKWVQTNIAMFGGDPRQVTIFGESAGSTAVGFHVLSERSRGLFLRSISMSGTPLCPWAYHTPENIIANAYHIAASLNYVPKSKNDLLNFFQRAPAMDLARVGSTIGLDFLPFRPTIEDPRIDPTNSSFLTECPITQYSNGNFYRHAMMMGYTRDEVILFLGPPIGIANIIDWAKRYINQMTERRGHMNAEPMDQTALLVQRIYNATYDEAMKIATDVFFSGPIDLTQRLLAKHNAQYPIYYYRLSYETEYSMHKLYENPLNGTSHFDDIGYIFYVHNLKAPRDGRHPFNRFRKKMVSMWANFAKYGDPTPKHLMNSNYNVTWKSSDQTGLQIELDENEVMHNRTVDDGTETYMKILDAALPVISSCVKIPTIHTDIF